MMLPFGNHPWFRKLFGWMLPVDPAFMKLSTTPGIRRLTFMKQVFQDITMPMTSMRDAVEKATECFDMFPLLLYPCKEWDHGDKSGQVRRPKPHQKREGTDWAMFFDLGLYGVPGFVKRKEPYNPSKAMRAFEGFVRDIGGHSFMYA